MGREKPDEVVVLGGHIDSWDVGQGAMDDGGGSVAAWEAVRLMHRLGLRPRRTVRVVLWTNEENGVDGGTAYRDAHAGELDKHVLAMESDGGVFQPRGVVFAGSDAAAAILGQVGVASQAHRRIGRPARRPKAPKPTSSRWSSGACPASGSTSRPSRYFWYHHTDGDTLDKLDPAEMARCVALMAVMAYVVADLPARAAEVALRSEHQQPQPRRARHRLRPGGHAELAEDGGHMGLHRVVGDAQPGGDRLVRRALPPASPGPRLRAV